MGKLIAKTALITLSGLIALSLVLWGIFSWLAPSIMVTITEGLGLDAASARYSVSSYKKSGDIEDLAYAVERSYSCGLYSISSKYGQELLLHEDFDSYSEEREMSSGEYRRMIAGMASVSLYYIGQKAEALSLASEYTAGEFLEFNGLERLLNAAMNQGDKIFVQQIGAAIREIKLEPSDTEGSAHREEVLKICDAFLNN